MGTDDEWGGLCTRMRNSSGKRTSFVVEWKLRAAADACISAPSSLVLIVLVLSQRTCTWSRTTTMPPQNRAAAAPARHDMSVILVTGSYDHDIRFWEAWSGICSRTIARTGENGVRLPSFNLPIGVNLVLTVDVPTPT